MSNATQIVEGVDAASIDCAWVCRRTPAVTVSLGTTMMSLGSVPAGTYTGKAIDEILITGPNANVFTDMTVQELGVPVRIAFSGLTVAPAAGATAPVTLTLRPGVIFKFPKLGGGLPGARITFGTNGNAPNNLVGVLNAIGTADKPIVFTSGETVPAPGDWIGIWLNTAIGPHRHERLHEQCSLPSDVQRIDAARGVPNRRRVHGALTDWTLKGG